MLDAYTVKKMLPRLILAVVFVNLSWSICTILLDFSNALGDSVQAMLTNIGGALNLNYELISSSNAGTQAGTFTLIGVVIGATLAYGSFQIFVPMLMVGAVALASAVMTVLFRQIMIIFLILASPIAIALWILPGTEALAKKWFNTYIKVLLMYPIIVLLLISGKFASGLFELNGDGDPGVWGTLARFILTFAPFFLVPFTFKFAGTTMGTVGGLLKNATRESISLRRKSAHEAGAMSRQAARQGRKFDGNSKRANFFNKAAFIANRPTSVLHGATGGRIGGKSATDFMRNHSREIDEAQEEMMKLGIKDHDTANEFARHGASNGTLRRRVKQLRESGDDKKVAQAARLERMYGKTGSRYQVAAMGISSGFGKLDDSALESLNTIYGNSSMDRAFKQNAVNKLRETNKGQGNFSGFAAGYDATSGQVYTLSSEDPGLRSKAYATLDKATRELGPGHLGQLKDYDINYAQYDDSGNVIAGTESSYNNKQVVVESLVRNAARDDNEGVTSDVSTGKMYDRPNADGTRGPEVTQEEYDNRDREKAARVEMVAMLSMEGSYTDANTKAHVANALANNPDAARVVEAKVNEMRTRGLGTRMGADGDGNMIPQQLVMPGPAAPSGSAGPRPTADFDAERARRAAAGETPDGGRTETTRTWDDADD